MRNKIKKLISVPPALGVLLIFTFSYFANVSHGFQICGVMYKETNQTGEKFFLLEGQTVANFEEEYVKADTVWNTSLSVGVEKGCKLTLCNDTHFSGECSTISESISNLPLGFDNVLSSNCSCSEECKCSDIRLRNSDCARAYIGGCNVCHPQYVNLKGKKNTFSEAIAQKISVLKVRQGCKLKIFPEEEYEGDETELEGSPDHFDFEGAIGSYECECTGKQPELVNEPRSALFPEWINVPSSMDGVSSMIKDKGLHPGLEAALTSLRNQRSSKNAYILVLGSTGSGKSSAINLLFDNPNVTVIGKAVSTTTDIHEFRVPVSVDELGLKNSELRIIDTPGLMDTRGLYQDAKFLATLDGYLKDHEELSTKKPNVILIFHKFSENRLSGPGTNFVKMLRGLDSFRDRITDSSYSNIVFVLSHFCSETKNVVRKPNDKLAQFKSTISDYSLFPRPIVISVAENKAAEQDLPLVNGYFKLPNGEYYPKNLFDRIQRATKNGGDPIGSAVIASAFRNADHFEINTTTYRLVGSGSKIVDKYHKIMMLCYYDYDVDVTIPPDNTTISQLLNNAYEKMEPKLQSKYSGSLQYLQKAMYIRGIMNQDDIPQTTMGILELLSSIKQNEAITWLLEKGLQVKPRIFPHNVVAGHSYNVFRDTAMQRSPFKLGDKINSDIGYLLPSAMTCNVENVAVDIFKSFDTKSGYIQNRLKDMGIEGQLSESEFKGATKMGYNIKLETFKNDSCLITAVREIRLFQLLLNDKPELSQDFTSILFTLPKFNQTDHESVTVWKEFFEENYGTHVVKSIYGGGAIEITLSSNFACSSKMMQALFNLIQFAEDLFSIRNPNSTTNDFSAAGISHQLSFKGGDSAYHTTDLTKMKLDDASKLLMQWKHSLKLNPIILTSDVKLIPLSQITRKLGTKQNISAELDRATSLYFNSSLKYIPPPKNVAPEDKESTQISQGSSAFFKDIFQTMMANQEAANKRHESLMEQYRQDQLAAEKRREDAAREWEEQREWERELVKQIAAERKLRDDERIRMEDQRMKAAEEYQKKRDNQEQIMREESSRREAVMQAAADRLAAQLRDAMERLANSPKPKSSCLKPGTKIRMADGTYKFVELLEVGDMIVDHKMHPTRILALSYEFLMQQTFYGFDNDSFFFTDSHILVGPGDDKELQFYVKNVSLLYSHNPLMEFIEPKQLETDEKVDIYKFENFVASPTSVSVKRDPIKHPEDTKVYFFQVESPHGTYFANGYVCRHEIPLMDGHWSNAMDVLFSAFNRKEFQKIAELPYEMENIRNLDAIVHSVKSSIDDMLAKFEQEDGIFEKDCINQESDNENQAIEIVGEIFNSPSFAAVATGVYGGSAKIMAAYLDGIDGKDKMLEDSNILKAKCLLYNAITEQLSKSVQSYFN